MYKELDPHKLIAAFIPNHAVNPVLIQSHSYFDSPRVEHSVGGVNLPGGREYAIIGEIDNNIETIFNLEDYILSKELDITVDRTKYPNATRIYRNYGLGWQKWYFCISQFTTARSSFLSLLESNKAMIPKGFKLILLKY